MSNLNFDQVAANQNQKEVTINDAFDQVDDALTEHLAVDLSTADVALTADQWTRNWFFECAGHTVARTVTLPPTKRPIVVKNGGTGAVTLQVSGGGAAVIQPAQTVMVYNDGVNLTVTGGGSTYPDMIGNAGKVLTVNDAEDAVEWRPGGRWPPFQPPAASSFTMVSGGATVFNVSDDADVGLQFVVQASNSTTLAHLAYRTLSDKSQDWDCIARITTMLDSTNYSGVGMGFMDSVGGRIEYYTMDARSGLYIERASSVTTWVSAIKSTVFRWAPRWLRISCVGSTVTFSVSADGKTWHDYYSESITAYLANRPDRVGLMITTTRTIPSEFSCDYFSLTGPAV